MQKQDILVNKPIYHLEPDEPMIIDDFLPELFRAVIHEHSAMFVIKPENVLNPFLPSQENPFYVRLMKDIARYLKALEAIETGGILKEEWKFFAKPILDRMPTVDWQNWVKKSEKPRGDHPFSSSDLRHN